MEYKVVETSYLESELNRLAKEGWRLHTMKFNEGSGTQYTLVMERMNRTVHGTARFQGGSQFDGH